MKTILLILPLILGASLQAMQQQDLDYQLRKAIRTENVQGVKTALTSGANIMARWDFEGATCLMLAAEQGNEEICKVLLDHKKEHQKRVLTILMCLKRMGPNNLYTRQLYNRRNEFFRPYLQEPSFDTFLNVRNTYDQSAFEIAFSNVDIPKCKLLLEYGVDPNTQKSKRYPVLREAAAKKGSDLCKLLLEHGANPNIGSLHSQNTPLAAAAEINNTEVCRSLLIHGAEIGIGNSNYFRGLMALVCITRNYPETLKTVITHSQFKTPSQESQTIAQLKAYKIAELKRMILTTRAFFSFNGFILLRDRINPDTLEEVYGDEIEQQIVLWQEEEKSKKQNGSVYVCPGLPARQNTPDKDHIGI